MSRRSEQQQRRRRRQQADRQHRQRQADRRRKEYVLATVMQALTRAELAQRDVPEDDQLPVGWFFNGKETMELMPNGVTRPSQWRAF